MLATQGNTYRLVRAVILHCDTERHISIRAYNTERQVSIRDEPCQREWQLDEAARAPYEALRTPNRPVDAAT